MLYWMKQGAHVALCMSYKAIHQVGSQTTAFMRKCPWIVQQAGWAALAPCRWSLRLLGRLRLCSAIHQYTEYLRAQPTISSPRYFVKCLSKTTLKDADMVEYDLAQVTFPW